MSTPWRITRPGGDPADFSDALGALCFNAAEIQEHFDRPLGWRMPQGYMA
jgi:hypothetical protein